VPDNEILYVRIVPKLCHLNLKLSYLNNAESQQQVKELVAQHQDATLAELCELFAELTGNWVSATAMWRCLQKLGLSRKKNTMQ